jgi:uncharacterized protein YbaP (TraB family)
MKGLLTLAIRLIAPLAALGSHASADQAAAPPDRPLLWKIESDALQKPSHLFGTIHLTTPRISKLHPAAERAFGQADAVVTEIPLDPKTQLEAAGLMMRDDGSKLSQSIGEDTAAKLGAALNNINPAFTAEIFEPMKTWAVATAVVMLPYQLKGAKSLDQLLWQRATAEDKPASGLEGIKDQLDAFEGGLSEAEQVTYLRATLENLDEGAALFEEIIAAYEKGDENAIGELMVRSIRDFGKNDEDRAIGTRLLKRLLTDRDVTMAETIDGILKKQPGKSHFFAVGAAHLIGDTSIRKHLETKGYRITRITE